MRFLPLRDEDAMDREVKTYDENVMKQWQNNSILQNILTHKFQMKNISTIIRLDVK